MAVIRHRFTFLGLINLYVLETPQGPVLVDTGAPGMYRWLLGRLRRVGLEPNDLAGVILTHAHVDHAGTAALFARAGVPVFASEREVPILTGEEPHPGYGLGFAGDILRTLERIALPHVELRSVEPLGKDARVFGSAWQLVPAPGHTPGSIALWNRESGDLLSGDTLVTTFGLPRGPVPLFSADISAGRRSARRLLKLGPRKIHPGHGPSVGAAAFQQKRFTAADVKGKAEAHHAVGAVGRTPHAARKGRSSDGSH